MRFSLVTQLNAVRDSAVQDGFIVEAASGHRFEDVDLSDDWADFDEKAGESVSIMGLEWRFTVRR